MIFHVTTRSCWDRFENQDFYHPEDYEKEGFIHCCTARQVDGVLERYFSGKEDLLLLSLDEQKLKAPVKYEASTNGELFPHVYGRIDKAAIREIQPI